MLRRKVVGPTKPTPPSAKTVSGQKRVIYYDDDHDDEDEASGGGSPQTSDSAVKKRRINRNGLVTLTSASCPSEYYVVLISILPNTDPWYYVVLISILR